MSGRMRMRSQMWAVAMAGLLVVAGRASGGFWALPLAAELDRAEAVAVGRLVRTEPARKDHGGRMTTSKGTIAVRQMLKGKPAAELAVTVVTALDADLGGQMQSPSRVYRVGADGIWVIVGGRPSHGYGVLAEARLAEVKNILARLSKRTWSAEVNGLRGWAGVVGVDRGIRRASRRPAGLVFAVRNVSGKVAFLPRSLYRNVVAAVAEDAKGTKHELSGIGDRSVGRAPLVCRPLRPAETRYMHPDSENYGYIVVPKTLPAGTYTVTVSLANQLEGRLPGAGKRVDAWKGALVAPPVTLVVPKAGGPVMEAPKERPARPPGARSESDGLRLAIAARSRPLEVEVVLANVGKEPLLISRLCLRLDIRGEGAQFSPFPQPVPWTQQALAPGKSVQWSFKQGAMGGHGVSFGPGWQQWQLKAGEYQVYAIYEARAEQWARGGGRGAKPWIGKLVAGPATLRIGE